jgi:hypothetical protein
MPRGPALNRFGYSLPLLRERSPRGKRFIRREAWRLEGF